MSTWEEIKMKAISFPMEEFLVAIRIAEARAAEITHIQAENERLNNIFRNQGNLREEIVELKDQLRAAEQRVARECCEIVDDTVSDHRWGYDGSCGVNTAIEEAIKAKYGL